MRVKITQKQKTLETTILQKLTFFFGGMAIYSIFFGMMYKLIGVWGCILALITGIACSIILIIKKSHSSRYKSLAYGVILGITIWFLMAISVGLGMLFVIGEVAD